MSDRNAIVRGGGVEKTYTMNMNSNLNENMLMVLLLHLFLLLLLLLLLSIRQFVTPQLNCALCWSRTNPSTAEWLNVLYFVCSSTRPSASARIQNYKTVHCKDPQQQFSPFCNSLQPTPNQKHRFLWSGGFACALWLLIVLSSFLLFPAYVSLNVFAQTISKAIYFWQNICQCISKTCHESCHNFRGWFRKSLWVTQWDD